MWGIHRTGEFPAQRASNAENVSIWWRHHDISVDHRSGPHWTLEVPRDFCKPYQPFWMHLKYISIAITRDNRKKTCLTDGGTQLGPTTSTGAETTNSWSRLYGTGAEIIKEAIESPHVKKYWSSWNRVSRITNRCENWLSNYKMNPEINDDKLSPPCNIILDITSK